MPGAPAPLAAGQRRLSDACPPPPPPLPLCSCQAWGASLAIAFPSADDACAFAAGLARVAVSQCSLAGSKAASMLEAHAPRRCDTPDSCPPSPSRDEQPLAGSKRKAAAAGLCCTPRAHVHPFAVITPACSGDLAKLL